MNTLPDAAALEKMFSSDQLPRVRELTLQYYCQVYGPAGVFVFRDAIEIAQLTIVQRAKVQTVLNETVTEIHSRATTEAAQRTALERATEERLQLYFPPSSLPSSKMRWGYHNISNSCE